MEWNFGQARLPYVLKSPYFCEVLDRLIDERGLTIDHALVPVRSLHAAAESRRDVDRRNPGLALDLPGFGRIVPGGTLPAGAGESQEAVLAQKLHRLLHTLADREIPTTLLHFPRLVHESAYLPRRLAPVLHGLPYEPFARAFARIARPELVHDFPAPGDVLP